MTGSGGGGPDPVRIASAALPACLGDLSHPPAGLWCLGDPSVLEGAPDGHVAIVGTREASSYGERVASRLAAACARVGLVVVSGLARGIDAAAHRAAMAAGGRTLAVQGTGVDVPYPVGHRALHRAIQGQGAVLAEMEPGTTAKPGCFPRRNRVIAALARVTVVVEAGFKSGALNTAGQALELGRVVAAVPGPVDDPRSAGSNQLIRDGASVVTDVEDLLMIVDLSTGGRLRRDAGGSAGGAVVGSPSGGAQGPGSRAGASILAFIGDRSVGVEALADATGTSVRQVVEDLLALEVAGVVERAGDGYRRRA